MNKEDVLKILNSSIDDENEALNDCIRRLKEDYGLSNYNSIVTNAGKILKINHSISQLEIVKKEIQEFEEKERTINKRTLFEDWRQSYNK